MTVINERVRPSGKAETDPSTLGEEGTLTVAQRSDNWHVRLLRQWPEIAVYLLATAATVWAAAWSVANDPGLLAVFLVGVASGNTFCAAVGITRLVRS